MTETQSQGSDRPRQPSADRFGWGLACLAATGMVAMIMGTGMSEGHSAYLNMSWFLQYREVLYEGTLPRHLPDLWGGLGGLDFFFYGHFPYITASLLSPLCIGCSDQQIFTLAMGLSFGFSLLAFFAFAKRFTGPVAALFAALVYALLPYHLGVDLIWRQAAGETWAYAFTPMIARGIDIVLREKRLSPGLSIFTALLLANHLPSALLAVHVFGVLVLIWCLATRDASLILAALLRLMSLTAIGFLLAAPFWLPAVTLIPEMTPGALRFDPTVWLFSFGAFGHPGDRDTATFVLACVLLSCLPLALLLPGCRGLSGRPGLRLWTFGQGLPVLLLMSGLSLPLWQMGLLPHVQFPFRLLVFLELAAALALAIGLDAWMRSGKGTGFAAFNMTLIGALALNMHIQLRATPLKPEAYLPHLPGVVEYLPHDFAALARDRNWDKSMWLFVWDVSRKAQELMREEGTKTVIRSSREIVIRASEGRDHVGVAVPWWRYWQAQDAAGDLTLERDTDGLSRIRTPDGRKLSGDIRLTIPLLGVERLAFLLSFIGAFCVMVTMVLAPRRARLTVSKGK